MGTTTNYGWSTPEDTDPIADGAADIRSLAADVDAEVAAVQADVDAVEAAPDVDLEVDTAQFTVAVTMSVTDVRSKTFVPPGAWGTYKLVVVGTVNFRQIDVDNNDQVDMRAVIDGNAGSYSRYSSTPASGASVDMHSGSVTATHSVSGLSGSVAVKLQASCGFGCDARASTMTIIAVRTS